MKSIKTLTLVFALLSAAWLATAVGFASGGSAPQSNSDGDGQTQTASAARRRPRTAARQENQNSNQNQNSDSNRNTSRRRSRDRQERHEDDTAHPSGDDQRTASAPRRPRGDDDSRYHVEVGIMPRHISNYFQTFDDFQPGATPVPVTSVTILSLSAHAEYDFVRDEGRTLTGGVRVRRNLFRDLPGGDSTDVDLNLEYDFRPNRLNFKYFGTPRRLASIVGGQNVYSQVNGFGAEYSRRLGRRWRTRGGYEFARDTFSRFSERDLSRHEVSGDVRYQISPYFTPGVGFEYLRGRAESEAFSYTRPAVALLASSRIKDVAYLSFRYRFSDRDYTTDDPTVSNFNREDRRHDISFYGTAQLGKGFSLFGFVYHTDNNSNRLTRTFTSTESGLGLFYRFPN
ncbi:MAG TPA: surface lipoprotein assembly modifier [Pyrinomonadaceae bacterium]|jgi:hypothetical protein|nr:surface lipoprotein assembly modifier [Pyrinomonadaceae bacterium]